MTFNVSKSKVARFIVTTLAVGVVAVSSASPVSAAKIGDACKQKDAYKIEKVGTKFIRCEIVPGTSLHSKEKKKAAKLARDKARALAAEKRRAQLAALKAKIAATQARGDVLKKKSSWINLMKNSSNSNSAKGLVRVPIK